MRPTSLTRTRRPPCAVWSLTMISANCAGSFMRDWMSIVYWKSWSFGAGGMPTWPAVTSWLCWRTALMTSFGSSPQRIELVGVEPDAHGVTAGAEDGDVADARQAGEIVDEIDRRVIAHEQAVILPVRRIERHDLQDRGVLFLDGDALRLHRFRQRGQRAVDAVLHQHLIDVGICADIEGHRQRIGAVGGAGRLHVEHLIDAIDLQFDRQGDGVDHRLRARARIARRHLHGRRHDVRIFGDGERIDRDGADQHDHDGQHIGEDRMLDEEFRYHGPAPFAIARRCWSAWERPSFPPRPAKGRRRRCDRRAKGRS